MRRVVVIGTTGSGKSTLAERLAAQMGLRVIELDALFWGRDWQPVPLELFRHRVERETRDDGWIVVEQDVLPGMGAPADSAGRNRRYLRELGI